jgi:hypothetical protein
MIVVCGEITDDGVEVFPIGSRVRVINYSPFRGLKGTIITIHMIAAALDEPFCFYLIALEGVQLKEPIWFEYTEVELLSHPSIDPLFLERARLGGGDQKGST